MKILYVTTISNTVNAFLIPHLKLLVAQGHQVDVAFNIVQEVNSDLIDLGCTIHNIEFQRSPLNRKNYMAIKKLEKLIRGGEYDIVHTHTPVASACVRFVCRKIKDLKVFYTAHGFHFYKGAPLINWLVYYPIEKFLARYTDLLITINKEDYEMAKKFIKAKKVKYVSGVGLDIEKYNKLFINKSDKRKDLGIPKDAFMILSIGELNRNKNHETIIKSIAKLNNRNIYFVICGQGTLEKQLRELAEKLDITDQVRFLGYRHDINEICRSADIFAFPSFREGLSVSLMEAMASGLPVVSSNIRGNSDLIEDGKGGYLVKPNDDKGFANALQKIIQNPILREQMGNTNNKNIKKFSIENVLRDIKKMYSEV